MVHIANSTRVKIIDLLFVIICIIRDNKIRNCGDNFGLPNYDDVNIIKYIPSKQQAYWLVVLSNVRLVTIIYVVCTRNRPEIRLNPVPAGFPASKSGSGSGPVSKLFAGF